MLMKWSPDLRKSFMIIILVMNFEANFHDLDNDHELITSAGKKLRFHYIRNEYLGIPS